MFRTQDLILLAVVFGSMVIGVVFPDESSYLGPFLSETLMGLLFLAFLRVSAQAIWETLRRYPVKLGLLMLTKLILLPVVIYPVVAKVIPAYALGVLLLAGVSTGLSASFFAGLVGASIPLVLAMTVVTTLSLPITLPLIVRILVGRELHIDLLHLAGFMATLIFVPFIASQFCQRVLPRVSDWVQENSYPISLVLFAAMNLGAFGMYASFLKAHHTEVVFAVVVGFGLAAFMTCTGMVLFRSSPPYERIAAAGALGWINNVLVIVLGSYFNDPLTSVLAALYLIPYYVLIIPLSHLIRTSRHRKDCRDLPQRS
jgi:bile acid:Na+ symporter, BASS family